MRFKDKKEAEKYVDDLEYGEFESYEDTKDIADFYGVDMSDDFYAAYNVVENVYGDIIFEEYDKVRAAENYRKMRMDPTLQRKTPPKEKSENKQEEPKQEKKEESEKEEESKDEKESSNDDNKEEKSEEPKKEKSEKEEN